MQMREVQSICQVNVEPQHDDRHYPCFDDHGKHQQRVKDEPACRSFHLIKPILPEKRRLHRRMTRPETPCYTATPSSRHANTATSRQKP